MAEQPLKPAGQSYGTSQDVSITLEKQQLIHVQPTDNASTEGDTEQAAEIEVVKWENYRLPIPVDHARFMRRVLYTLCLQLLITTAVIACLIYIKPVREWKIEHYVL